MIKTTTNSSGQDDRCRKRSAMIMQGLIVGGIVCVVLLALVGGLHYGTAGHSAPLRHTMGRRRGSSPWGLRAIVEPTGSQAGHRPIPGG